MDWFEKHQALTGLLAIAGVNAGGWVWKLVKNQLDLNSLRKDHDAMDADYREHKLEYSRHERDTSRHIDPVRDAQARKELTRRLDRIDEKLDTLLTGGLEPRRRKGDSEDD